MDESLRDEVDCHKQTQRTAPNKRGHACIAMIMQNNHQIAIVNIAESRLQTWSNHNTPTGSGFPKHGL